MDRKAAVVAYLARVNEASRFPLTTARTRTGREIHLASTGGGPTYCGVRYNSPVDANKLTQFASFCERCFGPHVFEESK
jgi:hypothetical protein